ncbi:hypothetical protein JCM10450v2_005845 [Rhodotorula kratochvilovae]
MGESSNGYQRLSRVSATLQRKHRYSRDLSAKDAPGFAQHDAKRCFTIHAGPHLVLFLQALGYSAAGATAFAELLCGRIEAWFLAAYLDYEFNAYRVWIASPRFDLPAHVQPSPGLTTNFHITLRPTTHELGALKEHPVRDVEFSGLPQLLAPPLVHPAMREYAMSDATLLSCKSPSFQKVTADNPVLSILDTPPPRPGYYRYFDLLTLLSPPAPRPLPFATLLLGNDHLQRSAMPPPPKESIFRLSWSADTSHLAPPDIAHLATLPAGTFLLPAAVSAPKLTASALDRGEDVPGLCVVCEELPATYPRARR